MNDDPLNDPAFRAAWVHLTPFQKRVIVWRAILLSIRERAFRFIQRITGGSKQ